MRRLLIVAALLLCLPMVGEGQSIRYYPAGSVVKSGNITLTEASATTYGRMTLPVGRSANFFYDFSLSCHDGTNSVAYVVSAVWYCYNNGTLVCNKQGRMTAAQAGSGGASITVATDTAYIDGNLASFQMAATCSLTQTLLEMGVVAHVAGPSSVVFSLP